MLQFVALLIPAMLAVCFADCPSEEIVYPRILEARGLNGEKVLYVRDDLTLNLEKSSVFSDNFVFTEDDGDNRLDRAMNGKDLETNLYQDEKQGSAVVVEESNGAVQVRGILGNMLAIEPLMADRSEDGVVPHKISRVDTGDNTVFHHSVDDLNLSNEVALNLLQGESEGQNALPEEFLVEVRIISDHVHNEKRTRKDLIEYFAVLLTEVNFLYKNLTEPRVEFRIAGITKSKREPYAKTLLDANSAEIAIDLCGTLNPLAAFSARKFKHESRDVVLFVSGLLPGRLSENGTVEDGPDGCATVCGVCSPNGVSAVSLRGGLGSNAVKAVAKRLGYSLGMVPEGSRPAFFTPGNENLTCPEEEQGYVMGGPGPREFSVCVQDQLKGCLMTKESVCFDQYANKKYD